MSLRSWLSSRRIELAVAVLLLAVGLFVRIRVIYVWRFAGSDSVGYLKLAHELFAHHRYALSPQHPLAWVRPPLYPMILAVIMPNGQLMGSSWIPLFVFNCTLELATGVLVWRMARQLAGPWAGLLALAATMLNPFLPLYSAALLTETPALFLATATLATLVLLAERRPRLAWAGSGALGALATLLRPDGLLLAAAFLPALIFQSGSWRDKMQRALLAAAAFVVVFAPWPLRNLVATGAVHPLGGRIDRFTQPVENYEGYWAWLRSWSTDWTPMTTPTTCFYAPDCPQGLWDLRQRGAYRFFDDEKVVQPLIQRRFREGLTPQLSHDFSAVAAAHRRARPLLVEVALPLSRAWSMWTSPNDELLQGSRPWIWPHLWPHMARWSELQVLLFLVGGAWLSWRRRTRASASALYFAVLTRTLVLAYTFYCMPRYTLEVLPIVYTLGAAGLIDMVSVIVARVRARSLTARPPAGY
jgi:hypothetical protein